MAFLAEQAGGTASDGKNRILDLKSTALHQRVPFICGRPKMVATAMQFEAAES